MGVALETEVVEYIGVLLDKRVRGGQAAGGGRDFS